MKTATFILGFLLLKLFEFREFKEFKEFVPFKSNSSFDNKVCFATDVVLLTINLNRNQCLGKCSLTSGCKSVFYKTENGQCVGCNAAYLSTVGVSEYIGTLYYALNYKEYVSTCVTGDSCIGADGTCWDGTCKCVMGYSFDFKTGKCGTHCERYGSTFQEYSGCRIFDFNDDILKPVSLEECQQRYITDSKCLSFEYLSSVRECHTTSSTPLSNSDDVTSFELTDLYMRNCEA